MKRKDRSNAKSESGNGPISFGRRTFLGGIGALGAQAAATTLLPRAALAQASADGPAPKELNPDTMLWYRQPAANWLEALPLGNGRIGAMVFGGVSHEQILLNEDTLYAEEPGGRTLPLDITKEFDHVVGLLKSGEYIEANDVVTKNWTGRSWPCYQPLGTLHLRFDGEDEGSDYLRQLDLSDAVAHAQYRRRGAAIEREVFTSHADNAVILRMSADKPGALDFVASFDSPHPTAKLTSSGPREIVLKGQLPGIALRRTLEYVEQNHEQWKYPELWNADGSRKPFATQILYEADIGNRGAYFEARLRVLKCDGKVVASNDGLKITGARELVLGVAAASSFNGYDKSPSREGIEPSTRTLPVLENLSHKSYAELRAAHVADHQKLFHRVAFHLEDTGEASKLPTDQRLRQPVEPDLSRAVLLYQLGRYLLISCSRPGTQPANLQGMWSLERLPPWACAYTVNVNIEMNYWGVETANLSECHEPLMDFMREMAAMGRQVATNMYHRPGWVMHHNTTIWRDAQPVDWIGCISFWPMAGGWLCQHLWEHYQFTGNREFLSKTAYPVLKGAAEFYDSWLIEDDHGHLLTPVSDSPENVFIYTDHNGKDQTAGLAMGCTLDMAIIRELFANVTAGGEILGIDEELRTHLQQRIPKLLPYQIGHRGQLLEWFKEFKDAPPRHNTSPYFPLYPSNQITPRSTPDLAAAEAKLLKERGGRGGGFPGAWVAGAWARLGNAQNAQTHIQYVMSRTHPTLLNGGGEVFQIDANLGGMAAIGEMLLQSHAGEIELLPALPPAWREGRISGLRARGGFEVDLAWRDGKLSEASIKSIFGTKCKVRYGQKTLDLELKPGRMRHFQSDLT